MFLKSAYSKFDKEKNNSLLHKFHGNKLEMKRANIRTSQN